MTTADDLNMVDQLIATMISNTSPKGQPLLLADQQTELRARFARYMRFGAVPRPGDLVREKEGLGTRNPKARATEAMIFERYLVPESQIDVALITEWRKHVRLACPDCIVWTLPNDGSPCIVRRLYDSHELDVVLEDERAPEAAR
jgi:hypothetical protein